MFAGINIKAQESIIMKIIKNISDLSLKGDSVIESSSSTYSHRLMWERTIWQGKAQNDVKGAAAQLEICSKRSLRWTSERVDYGAKGMWKSGLSKSNGLRGGLGSFVALCKSLKSPVPIFMGIPIIIHSDTPAESQEDRGMTDIQFGYSKTGHIHTLQLNSVVSSAFSDQSHSLHTHFSHLKDKGGVVGAVFLDLQKAFDTVNHNLLHSVFTYVNLIKSYLSSHSQLVKTDNYKSN